MSENTIIIIHSRVAIGYVGSNTTSFVLQMGGYEVITVPTVLYSNHLGYTTVGGGKIAEDLFSDILKGILKLEILKDVSTIITGFIGSAEQVRITADFIRTIKKCNPEILYLCDPVMGDTDKGQYVEPDVPNAIIEHLVPLADMLTPNQFEAERIVKKQIDNVEDIVQLLQERVDLSKQKIVITGGDFDVSRKDLIDNCIVENKNCDIIKTRKIDLHPPGTGELFTAHLCLSMLRGMKLRDAVTLSGDILSAVLLKMFNDNRTEFELRDILFSMNILK
ncbi:MAG: pyridoxal kinase [Paludibacter sp.]|nr:pyridoxal kinase [Paludibacter sp.]